MPQTRRGIRCRPAKNLRLVFVRTLLPVLLAGGNTCVSDEPSSHPNLVPIASESDSEIAGLRLTLEPFEPAFFDARLVTTESR